MAVAARLAALKDRLAAPVPVWEWHVSFTMAMLGAIIPYLITLLAVPTPWHEANPIVAYIIFELGWVVAAVYKVGLVLTLFVVAWWAASKELWMGVRAAIWPYALGQNYNILIDVRTFLITGIRTTPDQHHRLVATSSLAVMVGVAVVIYWYWARNIRYEIDPA